MKVLITGSAGMLGSAVFPAFARAGHETIATDLVPRPVGDLPMTRLDVRDHRAVRTTIDALEPDLVLHLAAETDLEISERDPDHAFLTNTIGTEFVALATRDADIPLVYISTAGVFDGEKDTAYVEFDEARPINVYGRSKYEGELVALRLNPRTYVVRAGWMVGGAARDHKFVRKIIDQIRDGAKVINAVDDKLGTPTYTEDFAHNLLALIATGFYGRYHMACGGEGSRYDVAGEIVRHAGRDDIEVRRVSSSFFAETYFAPRPRSEIMRNYMLELHGINLMRPWSVALADYLDTADFG
jgi:dTDP-4-dehydrorhamnose reductase